MSIDNFNDSKTITSPRSLEACMRLGVDMAELLPSYDDVADDCIAAHRWTAARESA